MRLRIEGVPPYDGDYSFDESRLTNRDIHTIKVVTNVSPLDYDTAAAGGDTDFVVAFAIIALRRSGRFPKIDEDALWDAELGRITILDEEEAEAGPPLTAPETPMTHSGAPSSDAGDSPPENRLRITGTDSSAMSA